MAKSMQQYLSDLRAAVRELKKTYRRKWADAAMHRKRDRLRHRIIRTHTELFKRAKFPGTAWRVDQFNDARAWMFKVVISLAWPKTGDGKILREAHKTVASLSTPLRFEPDRDMHIESTSYYINAVFRSNSALQRFVARHEITLNPAPVIDTFTSTITRATMWIQRIQKAVKRLNKISSK